MILRLPKYKSFKNQAKNYIVSQIRSFSSIRDKIKNERIERLKNESIFYPLNSAKELSNIRNLGIIAHIDAGKTTTTERMLYYAGALAEPGEVHDGNTVMDYMTQERERGITIRAAAITFSWNKFQFNLIDTPGHIDFSAEVERSLKVLDGAVAVFDGVSGVQSQTETVWFQANKFKIPRISFINKMDRQGASLEYTLESMQDKLNITPLVTQYPIGESEHFKGIVDLITMKKVMWLDALGTRVDIKPLDKKLDEKLYKLAQQQREKLLENLSLYDDCIADLYLEGKEISQEQLITSIKQTICNNQNSATVTLLGSALKNKGIQALMDACILYLPSPDEKGPIKSTNPHIMPRKPNKQEKLTAYCYKVVNQTEKGQLFYTRIYSGALNSRSVLLNSTRNVVEKVQTIYRVRANSYIPVQQITAGDIVAIQGLKQTQSGDTLIDSNSEEKFLLESLNFSSPVFIAALEYEYIKDKPILDQALKNICLEDSSLVVKEQEETGQILLQGQGELHLEVIKDRIIQEYNINIKLGTMRVAYKESIEKSFSMAYKLQKPIKGRPLFLELAFTIERINHEEEGPESELNPDRNEIIFDFKREPIFDIAYNQYKKKQLEKKRSKLQQNQEEQENAEKMKIQENKQNEDFVVIQNTIKPTEIEKIEDEFGEDLLYDLESIPFELMQTIESTIENSFSRGMLLGYPLMQIRVKIIGGKYSMKRTNQIAVEMNVANLMQEIIKEAQPCLLEPLQDVEINCPIDVVNTILNDIIAQRGGKIIEIQDQGSKFGKQQSQINIIKAQIPLASTIGYSTYLRSQSKGEASFIMKFKKFESVPQNKLKDIKNGYF